MLHSRFLFTVALSTAFVLTISLAGCTKYAPYDGVAYDCECGDMTWNDREVNLRMAEVESMGGTTFRYHVIADLREPAEIEAHEDPRDLVMTFTTDISATVTNLTLDSEDPSLVLQVVNAPGLGVDWAMTGAELTVAVNADAHVLTLTSMTAQRGNTSVMASGEFNFNLDD